MNKVYYYVVSHGVIFRKYNTIYFKRKDGEKIVLPIEKIDSIYLFGRVSLKSGAIKYFLEKRIPVHFFNKFGFYQGTLYPVDYIISGKVLVKQADHYLNLNKRLFIAKEILMASSFNIKRNLEDYKIDVSIIENLRNHIQDSNSITELMGVEGNIWDYYFSNFNRILKKFSFVKRERRPPKNEINALISFGNSLMYAVCLSEIYKSPLNPTISYLHEPSERRFSLALDFNEIFRPLISDRVIFELVNKMMINEDDFVKDLNFCILNENGKRKFLERFERKLNSRIKHKTLKRKVSFRMLVRMEAYKLTKHVLGMKEYKGLRRWW